MPRIVVLSQSVRNRLSQYIYNITFNSSVDPKYKVNTLMRALEKANKILDDLYRTLSIDCVNYKQTQFITLGKQYGYKQYQYRAKRDKTVWLFGCDTTPTYNFVIIMQNSHLCLSHFERGNDLIIENRQKIPKQRSMCKRLIRITEDELHSIIKNSILEILHNPLK